MIKVALAQLTIVWENKLDNFKKVAKLSAEAAGKGAKIVLFPEMSLTGFSMNTEHTGETDGFTVTEIKRIAVKERIAIGIGWVNRQDRLAENHYTIIDADGIIISDYIKMHPFSYAGEDQYFASGNQIKIFEFGGFKWSTFICYDLRFPEIFQIASEKCDIIVVPANWPGKRQEHWDVLLKARAIENQCFVLGINCVGDIGNMSYMGGTAAISPLGEVLDCIKEREGLLIVEIDKDVLEIRNSFPVKKDRRWDEYVRQYSNRKN